MITVFTKDNAITFREANGYRIDTNLTNGFSTVTITKTDGDYIKEVAVFNFGNIVGVAVNFNSEWSC